MDRISIRIAFLFTMIFSLLIFTYYSASVVSARLDDSTTRINDSLMQLGKLNLKMATEDMVYFEFFMKVFITLLISKHQYYEAMFIGNFISVETRLGYEYVL